MDRNSLNEKRALVILTQAIEFNTSSMIRTRNVIRGMIQNGYGVVCYTPAATENSIYFEKMNWIDEHLEIRRYGTDGNGSGSIWKKESDSFFRRLCRKVDLFGASIIYVRFWKSILGQISKENYDVMLSFSDPKPSHILAGMIKRRRKDLLYIQQWGDPLTLDITLRSVIPTVIKKKIEEAILSRADRICYCSPITLDIQKKLFKKQSTKMIFVPTPCEPNISEHERGGSLKIGYLGSYNKIARDIMPLYEAANMCKDTECFFIGDSDIKLEETKNTHVIPRVSHQATEEYVSQMDVLVCLMNRSGTQIPGKIFNYAGTNKEILVILDGENKESINSYFEKYDRYTFVDNDKGAIYAQLAKYIDEGVPTRQPLEAFMPARVANMLIGGI